MKTFEEKWTAWVDGQLSGRELAEFEASLPDKAAAEAERASAQKLGKLLKRELGARTLTNEELFSHQLRERIAQEGEQISRPPGDRPLERSTAWTTHRLSCTATVPPAVFSACRV